MFLTHSQNLRNGVVLSFCSSLEGTLRHFVENQALTGSGIGAGQALDARIRRLHIRGEATHHGFVETVDRSGAEITEGYGPAEPARIRDAGPRGALEITARPRVAIHHLIKLESEA